MISRPPPEKRKCGSNTEKRPRSGILWLKNLRQSFHGLAPVDRYFISGTTFTRVSLSPPLSFSKGRLRFLAFWFNLSFFFSFQLLGTGRITQSRPAPCLPFLRFPLVPSHFSGAWTFPAIVLVLVLNALGKEQALLEPLNWPESASPTSPAAIFLLKCLGWVDYFCCLKKPSPLFRDRGSWSHPLVFKREPFEDRGLAHRIEWDPNNCNTCKLCPQSC